MAEPAYIPPERRRDESTSDDPFAAPVGTPRTTGPRPVPVEGVDVPIGRHGVPPEAVEPPADDARLTPYDIRAWQGAMVFDVNGDPVGKVSDILVDEHKRPEWMIVSFGAFLHEDRLVPVFDLEERPEGLVVSYTRNMVRDAPVVGVADMSEEDEQKVMSYWCTTREARSPRACTFYGR